MMRRGCHGRAVATGVARPSSSPVLLEAEGPIVVKNGVRPLFGRVLVLGPPRLLPIDGYPDMGIDCRGRVRPGQLWGTHLWGPERRTSTSALFTHGGWGGR